MANRNHFAIYRDYRKRFRRLENRAAKCRQAK